MTHEPDITAINSINPDHWYTDETLRIFPKRTMQDMRRKGDGPPFIRIRGRVLYSGHSVLQWLAGFPEETGGEE